MQVNDPLKVDIIVRRDAMIASVRQMLARLRPQMQWATWKVYIVDWLIIAAVAFIYSGETLLDFDVAQLQQTGEHNESVTLPLLADIGLKRYGEIPLWNPYMLTGFPHVGDLVNHFWNPVATLPVIIWGGINGMKVSIFLSFLIAGVGQWLFAHVFGARRWIRLWAGLLFMLSGGLALLWQVGWYELLVGMAWFPWCFATLWWALQRRDRASLAWTAICVAMVLSAGGGYYPFYLFVSLSVLAAMSIFSSRAGERAIRLRRTITIAFLSAALLAVMLLPIIDGYANTFREAGSDAQQRFSQPIPYALINYVVSEPQWFRTEILGTAGGWNWFYIGFLPVASALALAPLAYVQHRRHRLTLLALAVLTLVLLAWHANQHTPVKYIYEWIPILYNLRFPNRLLILIASPLIVLAGLGLQYLFSIARVQTRGSVLTLSMNGGHGTILQFPLRWFWQGIILLTVLLSLVSVYQVNKGFAFAPRPRNEKASDALRWLKDYDPGLYYVNIGGGAIYWDWIPAAYDLEMPVINFDYGRRLTTFDTQRAPTAPFFAMPKYILALPDQPRPDNAQLLQDFDGVGLWYAPDALPFAFRTTTNILASSQTLTAQDVSTLDATFDGPNRVIVVGAPGQEQERLVALVSNYPGWRLTIDGQAADIWPANDYLGAAMLRGEHTYIFSFEPPLHYLGLAISLLALTLIVIWIAHPKYRMNN